MPVFVIFVEGADTEPEKLPVYIVESEEHASLICEGMKESDYQTFDFSFKHCTRSDRGKFAVWAKMTWDAREGVYGNIVGGIYNMIDEAYSIISGRRSREKIASGADTETGNGGSTTAKQDDETADDNGQPPAQAAVRLLNIYTNGLADERLEKASIVLNSDMTVDEKLWKIDELMPIPPTVSGEKLGNAFGVSKTAIQNTSWYKQKRKGRKDEEIAQRGDRLRQRGKTYERDRQADDDE